MKKRDIQDYTQDTSGQVAVIFALMAIPLLTILSASMDYTSAVSEKSKVKGALDSAVIAAMSNNALTPAEKEDYAVNYFNENYAGRLEVALTPAADENHVRLSASATAEHTIGKAVGLPPIKIGSTSAAEIASENTICVLALSPDMAYSVSFEGDLNYSSPTCAVYSNSKHRWAISSAVKSSPPSAKSFCAVGGVEGKFFPHGKGECKPIEDPYSQLFAPAVGDCSSGAKYVSPNGGTSDPLNSAIIPRGVLGSLTGSNAIMKPGTYCGGLTVDGTNVLFLPGDYVMVDGPMTFTNGSQSRAENVTFSFEGDQANLYVEDEAEAFIKAPLIGARKGIAFMEISSGTAPGNQKLPNGSVEIVRGGKLEVNGTLYFPTKEILVRGSGSSVGATAPATSFIANNIRFMGNKGTRVEVKVDHVAAGIPPILPRAEDGVRLSE